MLFAVYVGAVAYRCFRPVPDVSTAPIVNAQEVAAALAALDVPAGTAVDSLPSWSDVFADMARNYGTLSASLRGRPVVWCGRVVHPRFDANGRLRTCTLTVDPSDSNFGGPMLPLFWEGEESGDIARDGAIVTVVARLGFRDRPKTVPDLRATALFPGRLALAAKEP